MYTLTSYNLTEYKKNAKGKIVLITGATSPVGKATALEFAKAGSILALGDDDGRAGDALAAEIVKSGGKAQFTKVNVASWEEQLAWFQSVVAKHGTLDIVLPLARASVDSGFDDYDEQADEPTEPNLDGVKFSQLGAIFTSKLGFHYLTRTLGSHKAIVLYTDYFAPGQLKKGDVLDIAWKHGIIGLNRSFAEAHNGFIRVCTVATEYSVEDPNKAALAFFRAATDTDVSTNGSYYTVESSPEASSIVNIRPRSESSVSAVGAYLVMIQRASWILALLRYTGWYFGRLHRLIRG